jgi:hypothetical protein
MMQDRNGSDSGYRIPGTWYLAPLPFLLNPMYVFFEAWVRHSARYPVPGPGIGSTSRAGYRGPISAGLRFGQASRQVPCRKWSS